MRTLTVAELRDSFVNCSKREAAAITLPDVADTDWDALDFLAWHNPRMPQRAYLASVHGDATVGLVLRAAQRRSASGAMRSSMCEFCQTVHSAGGVTLFTARKAGAAGRRGDSVGTYICSDLDCSAYIRDRKRPKRVQPESTLTLDERVDRLTYKLNGLVGGVLKEP